MPAPTLAAAPTAEELSTIACPLTRARIVTALARTCGTLPRPLADIRRASLTEARQTGRLLASIAAEVGLSPARISQLTAHTTQAGTAAGLADEGPGRRSRPQRRCHP